MLENRTSRRLNVWSRTGPSRSNPPWPKESALNISPWLQMAHLASTASKSRTLEFYVTLRFSGKVWDGGTGDSSRE